MRGGLRVDPPEHRGRTRGERPRRVPHRDRRCGEVLDRAVGRGEIGAAVDSSLAVEAGAAILVQRWLLLGAHIDEALVTVVVDDVMLPLLRNRNEERLPDLPTPGATSSER